MKAGTNLMQSVNVSNGTEREISTRGAALRREYVLKDFQDAIDAIHKLLDQIDRRARPLSQRRLESAPIASEHVYVQHFAVFRAGTDSEIGHVEDQRLEEP